MWRHTRHDSATPAAGDACVSQCAPVGQRRSVVRAASWRQNTDECERDDVPSTMKSAATGGMAADFSSQPEAMRRFVDVFLAAHHQRVLAEEDPATTLTADQTRDRIDRAEVVISEFLSAQPEQLRDFAVHLPLYRPSEGMAGTGEAAFR